MSSISRQIALRASRFTALVLLASSLSACSFSSSDESGAPKKKGWISLPFGGSSRVTDATQYLEYQRKKTGTESEPMLTLYVRNTNAVKTIEGQMHTTMTIAAGDLKVDSQNFTLAPNEQKRLLIYPARFPLTYEVTATFR